MPNLTMYDSVTVSEIPANPQATAGYVGGLFPNESLLVRMFPRAKHLPIAVNAEEDADCLDIENGDAAPGDAPAWFLRQRARGVKRPCFYANASTMPVVLQMLGEAGVQRSEFRLWVAHYTDVAHIEPDADATQWTDHGGSLGVNLDVSECKDDFFDPPAPARNPVHYEWFDRLTRTINGRKYNEEQTVREYDRLRKHPFIYRPHLKRLRADLKVLADRCYSVAVEKGGGVPDWKPDHLGYRFQQLIHRAQGMRFV